MPAVVGRARREAGKSPLLIGCWTDFRGPLVYNLRAVGVSLWQPISYDEAELLVAELLADPNSRLGRAFMAAIPVDDAPHPPIDEALMDEYREKYGLGG